MAREGERERGKCTGVMMGGGVLKTDSQPRQRQRWFTRCSGNLYAKKASIVSNEMKWVSLRPSDMPKERRNSLKVINGCLFSVCGRMMDMVVRWG